MRKEEFFKILETAPSLENEAKHATTQRFGRVIQLFAPVYLSNECVDTCTYCGFSFQNKIPRRTLTVTETVKETEFLIAQGFRHILYVAGEHPIHVSPNYLKEVIAAVRPRLASISIEVAPFSTEVYKDLITAGLDGVVLYQETYDRARYAESHLAGPKKNYERRLAAAEETLSSGIAHFGMGILLGLSDWREDAFALVQHLESLRKKYWRTEFTVSLPRLKACASSYDVPHPVSDEDFLRLVIALRILLPEVGLVLSTREPAPLRDRLLELGVTRVSAGSRTEPGGYLEPEEALKQFENEDRRTPSEVASAIRAKGLEPVWKDWEKL